MFPTQATRPPRSRHRPPPHQGVTRGGDLRPPPRSPLAQGHREHHPCPVGQDGPPPRGTPGSPRLTHLSAEHKPSASGRICPPCSGRTRLQRSKGERKRGVRGGSGSAPTMGTEQGPPKRSTHAVTPYSITGMPGAGLGDGWSHPAPLHRAGDGGGSALGGVQSPP